jgi:hypothetical protein
MEDQSKECIFFLYPKGVKGYMLLYTTSDIFFIQRSDKFKEGPSQVLMEQSTPPSPLPLVVELRETYSDQKIYHISESDISDISDIFYKKQEVSVP